MAESRDCSVAESRNCSVAESRNCSVAESIDYSVVESRDLVAHGRCGAFVDFLGVLLNLGQNN